MNIEELGNKIISGDRLALSRGITLIESLHGLHQKKAIDLLTHIGKMSNKRAQRIAVSGAPGVGKSTLIEDLGSALLHLDRSVAVLAIDPSSEKTGGSILGDKTRMSYLSKHPKAFVRPTPNTGKYGGIGASTYESIQLCEAAGYQVVFIETVGAGQAEIEARHLVDLFLLLLQPGAGDDLQGIKRGIMEVADQLIITKNDGAMAEVNAQFRMQLEPMWRVSHPGVPILSYSTLDKTNTTDLWNQINKTLASQLAKKNKGELDIFWFRDKMKSRLLDIAMSHYHLQIDTLESQIAAGELHYLEALNQLATKMAADLD